MRRLFKSTEPPLTDPKADSAPVEAPSSAVLHPLPRSADGPPRPKLGELLLADQLISPDELSSALDLSQASGRRLGAVLVESGLIDPRTLNEALAAQHGIPAVDLRKVLPSPEALALVTEQTARQHRVVPLALSDETLDIAVADPSDRAMLTEFERWPVPKVSMLLATAADIDMALDAHYRVLDADDESVQQFWAASTPAVEQVTLLDADAPVIQLVNRIVAQALRDRASDIHIEPTDGETRIRFRVDGALHEVITLPVSAGMELVSRIKVMAEMDIVERRRPQDGQFQAIVEGTGVDVRVTTASTIWGELAVLRLLDKRRSMKRLGELGMPAETYERYLRVLEQPYGMILCSGPTGSGKTTTLYASLAQIGRPELNITTIEDPVELVVPSVNQMQILPQAGITFASGLKSILRQDPDVILVGEIRDEETARIAVQSALTGHLMMSSIHATDACSAMSRLIDMGIEPFLVASAVVGIVGQRLVRKICPSCVHPYEPSAVELAWYAQVGTSEKHEFVRGEGCNFCGNTGFRERVGVYEVLEVTDEISRVVLGGGSPIDLREVAHRNGMQSMAIEGARLVADDVTTIDEVIRHVHIL